MELFRDFLESGELESLEVTVRPPSESKFALSLERDLEDYTEAKLQVIKPGLRLYREGDLSGRQFGTDVSRIDMLGIDAGGNFVVIELKAGRRTGPCSGRSCHTWGGCGSTWRRGRRCGGL